VVDEQHFPVMDDKKGDREINFFVNMRHLADGQGLLPREPSGLSSHNFGGGHK
jgi:hypothetical protein